MIEDKNPWNELGKLMVLALKNVTKFTPLIIVISFFVPYYYLSELGRLDVFNHVLADFTGTIANLIFFVLFILGLVFILCLPSIFLISFVPTASYDRYGSRVVITKSTPLISLFSSILILILGMATPLKNHLTLAIVVVPLILVIAVSLKFLHEDKDYFIYSKTKKTPPKFSILKVMCDKLLNKLRMMFKFITHVLKGEKLIGKITRLLNKTINKVRLIKCYIGLIVWSASFSALYPLLLIDRNNNMESTSEVSWVHLTTLIIVIIAAYYPSLMYFSVNEGKQLSSANTVSKTIRYIFFALFFTLFVTFLISPNLMSILSQNSVERIGKSDWQVRTYLIDKTQYPEQLFSISYWKTEERCDISNSNYFMVKGINASSFGGATLLCPESIKRVKFESHQINFSHFPGKRQLDKQEELVKIAQECLLIEDQFITRWSPTLKEQLAGSKNCINLSQSGGKVLNPKNAKNYAQKDQVALN